jgi:hypothetical protein
MAEIRFPKNSLEDGVSGVRSLDVVAPYLVFAGSCVIDMALMCM